MTVFDRLLLVLIFLALFAKGVVMLAVGLVGWDPGPFLAELGQTMTGAYRVQTTVLGLVELLLASYLLAWAVRRRHFGRALVRETELGKVRIALKAVESLVQRAARQAQGVRDVRVDLQADKQGVAVHLSVVVAPDLAIPSVADEIQRRVEQYITETVGVTVTRVAVTFRTVSEPGGKPRVE